MIKNIHHVSILTSDLTRSVLFYAEVLKLALLDHRPDLGFDGAWFNVNGDQQIHLIAMQEGRDKDSVAMASRCGRDRHVAFRVDDFERLISNLERAGVHYERSRSGRDAIFCRDPDGNALEFIAV